MRPKSTEKTLIDLYRFKKYDYFEVKTYIEKWIDHFNVAGRYDYRINKERETLPDILEKSLLNGCIPKADRVSAKQIIHIPDIYVKFGATPEECLKFKIIDNFIYINEDIGKILGTETPNKMLLPPEILSVYQAVFAQQKGVMDNPITYTYINRNMTQGGIYHKRVQRIVKRDIGIDFMHKAQINAYEILKEAVVSVYSSNDSEYDTDIYSVFQTPVSAYYYAKLRDYESCIVDKDADTVEVYKSIDPNHAKHGDIWKKQFETVSRVSEEMFRFDTLFAYPGMQEHFIENHMFTSCAPGRFVLCPEAANLACGVQGEVASKFILQKELGMIFHPIEDGFKYERFDVQLRPDVYIDFKNYKHGELLSFQMHNLISHAQEKAKKIQAKKVYIVNLIADEKSAVESYDTYTDNSVPIVYINGLIDASGHIIASHLAQFRKEDYERKEN